MAQWKMGVSPKFVSFQSKQFSTSMQDEPLLVLLVLDEAMGPL